MRAAWIVLGLLAAQPAWAQSADKCNAYDTDSQRSQCDAAISTETDSKTKVDLLYHRAYGRVEKFDYDGALGDLSTVLTIDPRHAAAYHERAYIWSELGEYRKAADDLGVQERLAPERVEIYVERAFARSFLGDLQGAYEDRDRVVKMSSEDGDAVLARARAAMWLGRFNETLADIAAAEAIASTKRDADLRDSATAERNALTVWQSVTKGGNHAALCEKAGNDFRFDGPNLIGDCTAAFLAASDAKEKASILSVRANAWTYALNDADAGTVDLRMAVAFDSQNAGWLSNLGYAYLNSRHSWAAEREFDRSLAIDRTFYALAGRASARFNQGEIEEAFADAKVSFEIEPNTVALIVLGDIMMTRQDRDSAKQMWMGAYHLGSRDDGLMARLKEIGVSDPDKEPRQ